MRVAAGVAAATAILAGAAPATAARTPIPAIRTPSGNIACARVAGARGYLHCDVRRSSYGTTLQRRCTADAGLDWHGFDLGPATKGAYSCAGGIAWPGGERPAYRTLAYGRTWRSGSFVCVSARAGLTCRDGAGHGLFLSRRLLARLVAAPLYDRGMARDDATFADVLAANEEYARGFPHAGLDGRAARGLAVVTCMDARIDPLALLGLRVGEAKVVRNAGGRVTDEVLDTLVLARYLLGVERALVIAHTGCRMAGGGADELHAAVREAGGPDTRSLSFATTTDQEATLQGDVQRIRSSPYLTGLAAGGFLYDVESGRLRRVC